MLSLFKGLLSLFNAVAEMFSRKQMMDAGAAINEVKNVQAEVTDMARAVEVRAAVRAADIHTDSTDGLPDDGFRRD